MPIDKGLPAPDTVVQLSSAVREITVPCLKGDYIEAQRGFSHPGMRGPLVFIDDVPVAELFDSVSYPTVARNLVRAWTPRLPAEAALRFLGHLWSAGILFADGNC